MQRECITKNASAVREKEIFSLDDCLVITHITTYFHPTSLELLGSDDSLQLYFAVLNRSFANRFRYSLFGAADLIEAIEGGRASGAMEISVWLV
jgi:hypothetical protein